MYELVRDALPAALGELIEKGTPTLSAATLDNAFQALVSPAFEALVAGQLPPADVFPLAAPALGTEVDPKLVQVLDKDEFAKMLYLTMFGTTEGERLFDSPTKKGYDAVRHHAFRQDDGTLHFIVELSSGERLGTKLKAHHWQLVTSAEIAQLTGQMLGKPPTLH